MGIDKVLGLSGNGPGREDHADFCFNNINSVIPPDSCIYIKSTLKRAESEAYPCRQPSEHPPSGVFHVTAKYSSYLTCYALAPRTNSRGHLIHVQSGAYYRCCRVSRPGHPSVLRPTTYDHSAALYVMDLG